MEVRIMKTWRIWYYENHEEKAIYIKADSYDEALAKVRKFDWRYSVGQVVDDNA